MANYTYVDSETIWDKVADNLEIKGPFAVCYQDEELLALLYNNKAVMFAGVYVLDNGRYEVQVEEVLNEDLDTYTVELNAEGNVATLQEAGAVVRKAFEEMQDKLMQDNF